MKNDFKYSLGLDIGTTSIGWAVIDEDKKRIHDVGVRIFEKPEDPQSGKSLAEPRRMARSARRRLKRRRQRLDALKKFFVENQLLTQEEIDKILAPENHYNPYEIRERAVKEKVSNEEMFIALYSIAKRRGYKSNRKSLEEKDSESSRVLSAISENKAILSSYLSVANALNNNDKFTNHKRNKSNSYVNSFARQDFLDEAKAIIDKQRSLGFSLGDDAVRELLYADEHNGDFSGIFSQRPFMDATLINKMRGICEYENKQNFPDIDYEVVVDGKSESGEFRAPRASYSFELFRIAQSLSHLRVTVGRDVRALTTEEIKLCIEKAKSIKTLKYSHVRDVLGYRNDESFKFARGMIRGKIKDNDKSGGEANKFDEMTFYHAVKIACKNSPAEWTRIESDVDLFDQIGEVLTMNKDDVNLRKGLETLNLSDELIVELLKHNFSGFGHLSIKALHNITPFLLEGKNYDEAVASAGYQFLQNLSGDKHKLPPLSKSHSQQITNPVAKRAISQSIKVVNAVILKYGAPNKIKIEAAGDLAKTFTDRQKIKKAQDENADYNEKLKNRLVDEFGVAIPTGLQITKFKLYNQQNGKCMYSGKPLALNQLFTDERYGEIDHIIPFSRCGHDGLNNKVLVLTEENQQKRNLTPYEAWGSDEAKWRDFESRVEATFLPSAKKERLLAKSLPNEDWNERAINDTRYISKFLRRYIRDNLKFADFPDEKGTQRVITPSGSITSYLRRAWHVGSKSRDENNLHHATDACIIAAIDQGTIQKVSRLNKYYELFKYADTNEVIDRVTDKIIKRNELEQHSADIEPWLDFGKEVRIRTALYSSPSDLQNALRGIASYDDNFRESVKPIFVSRMPKRSGKGATNKETIRSPKIVENYENNKGEKVVARKQRVPLTRVKFKDLYDSPVRQDVKLYEVLKQRLEAFNDDPQKAFATDNPIYKPTKDGSQGNIVRSIKIYDTQNSKTGFYINQNKAFVNNGSTVRLDVFTRKNYKGAYEYYFAPVYTHLIHAKKVEILPTPNGRSADEKAHFDAIREIDGKIYATEENGFTKKFSIYPNDYIRVYMNNKIIEGYYVKYGISGGTLNLIPHSQTSKANLDLLHISPKAASSIERYDISILGDNYRWI